ncbi:MAG: GNAT family N-acetyltransferase [Nakamurella sp.]
MADTLTERGLTVADAPAVTEVMAAMEAAEPIDETLSESDVIEEMTAPGVDLERSGIAVLDGDRLVGFGWLRVSAPSASWKALPWAGVLPGEHFIGIGRRIMAHLEARATDIRDADAPGLPGELKIWVEETRPTTAELVRQLGYETWRYFFRMRRDLTEPVPTTAGLAGLLIRQYRPEDDDAFLEVSNASFGDHWGSTPMDRERWRAEFADSPSFRPELSYLALVDGDVVSFVLTSEFEADTEHRGYSTGYIARVGSLASVRGRGIASALLVRTLQALAQAGYRYAELGVDADSPTGAGRIYQRAGFTSIGRSYVAGKHF